MFLGRIVSVAFLVSLLVSCSNATLGLDLSFYQGDVQQSTWNCLHGQGYSFAVVQVWEESGKLNQYAANDIKRAYAAGFAHVDAYIFPRFGMDAGTQVRNSVNFLKQEGAHFGMIWFDIEDRAEWGNCDQNVNFLHQLVQAAQSMGVRVGIYASESQWSTIMCGRSGFSDLPLWYPHYDGVANFNDFHPFAGWTKPSIKQYRGNVNTCGTTIDANWYP